MCRRCSPWAVWLIGAGLGILLGALLSSAVAAVLLGLGLLIAGLLLLKR